MNKKISYLSIILSMTIFGSIGIFRRFLPMSSALLAFFRGLVGALFLLLFCLCTGKKQFDQSVRKKLPLLLVSGGLIGFNWILLFESYNYTTVPTATLCYYMAPVIVLLLSPLFLKEKLTAKKAVCAVLSLFGIVLVSGILKEGGIGKTDLKGILFGLGAALLYAAVIMLNQKLGTLSAFSKTILQLFSASLVILPYLLLTEGVPSVRYSLPTLGLLLLVGILHTGVAYALYFGSMSALNAQSVALLGYIDPVVAILLSALILKEPFGFSEAVGALLILGSSLVAEIDFPKKKKA